MTAPSAAQPKWRPRKTQKLPITPKPYMAQIVTTIQCRAETDAIEGAASRRMPPQIHPTVPICQQIRIRARSRGGSMVALENTLVSPRTPWITATTIAAMPAAERNMSCIGRLHSSPYSGVWRACTGWLALSIQWCMVAAAGTAHGRSALRQRLAGSGHQDARPGRLYGAESRAAGQGDGGVTRQLLLALRRCRSVPCGNSQILARDRG